MALSRFAPPSSSKSDDAVAASFHRDAGRALATLARAFRDLDLAEDAVQDAYVMALDAWQRTGVPENPVAWIVRTARNGAIDRLRREARGTEKSALAARLDAGVAALEPFDALDAPTVPDDRLGLIFACAHPSLNEESQVALTLRSVGGLTTDEIAAAFLVPPATMAQRLVRAKRKIRDAGIPFSLPGAAVLSDRVDAVCSVIYLIFNAGYIASSGDDALRDDLCTEAVRLATLLAELLPAQAEVHGLVALLYLQHARRAARTDAGGDIITLEDQDRTRWDRADIDRGMRALLRAAALGHEGPYQLQAAIAAVHARAPDPAATNWPGIAALYARLQTYAHSPIVELNRAVAIAMSDGPNAGLAIVEALEREGSLAAYHLLPTTRAHLLKRLERWDEAAEAYASALALARNPAERRFLTRCLDECARR